MQTACAQVNVHTGRSAVVGLTWLTAALPWLLRLKVSNVLVPQLRKIEVARLTEERTG